LILGLLFFNACGRPPHTTPAATPVLINVALTPAMGTFREVLHSCSKAHTEFILNVYESSAGTLDQQSVDLVIQLGGDPDPKFTYPIGEETIDLIVNSSNNVMTISEEKLRDIFSGRITSWAEVGGEQQPVHVWIYPDVYATRRIFDGVFTLNENLSPNALIAPNPQAMLEAIGDDPLAIGYVPQSWLAQDQNGEQVRPLQINQKLVELLHQPVYALSQIKPGDALQKLLICLQSTKH